MRKIIKNIRPQLNYNFQAFKRKSNDSRPIEVIHIMFNEVSCHLDHTPSN